MYDFPLGRGGCVREYAHGPHWVTHPDVGRLEPGDPAFHDDPKHPVRDRCPGYAPGPEHSEHQEYTEIPVDIEFVD